MTPDPSPGNHTPVLRLRDIPAKNMTRLLEGYGLQLELVPDGEAIPGSYFHDEEAGIIGLKVLVRQDTPLHSILHEACHTICMDGERRAVLHTDAGGEYEEENAVCYLQILLADLIPALGRERMLQDMDTWGYTFRLGSAGRWFHEDAEEAHQWLIQYGLLGAGDVPVFRLRQ